MSNFELSVHVVVFCVATYKHIIFPTEIRRVKYKRYMVPLKFCNTIKKIKLRSVYFTGRIRIGNVVRLSAAPQKTTTSTDNSNVDIHNIPRTL